MVGYFIHRIFYTPDILYTGYFIHQIKCFIKRYKRILINITKPWEFHLTLHTLSETT